MANSRNKAIRDEDVELSIQYYGPDGLAMDADSGPEIAITDPDGATIVATTSTGITRSDTGLYVYTYSVEDSADKGLWTDVWTATVDGVSLSNEFKFLVVDEASATAGTITLGDDVDFDFSEEELEGVNTLLKYLKCRVRSDGQKPSRDEFGAFITDGYGELVMEDCPVFTDEILVCFLCQALSEFNMVPFFTSYSFSDQVIKTLFSSAVVEGAYVIALASQALVEKGRDFTITDGGISYQPPQLGDFLQSHFGTWLTAYRERLKFIKASIRPGPRGFGTYTNVASGAPAFMRLRHLRQRRIV
tara:strand:+ start:11851 stop:12759 length:909 start_codon:yes stop_codon:yes gene_type:complete